MSSDLPRLASLLKSRNTVDGKVASLIGRATNLHDVSMYIASVIFGIQLAEEETFDDSDGWFTSGALSGRSVAIQWYPKREGSLRMKTDTALDYYLVLSGPHVAGPSIFNPWVIEAAFLFDSRQLLTALRERGIQIGNRTSIIRELWDRAEIYPKPTNHTLVLSNEQRALLALFQP